MGRPFGQEPLSDAPLVEDLDGARVEPARARTHQLSRGATLDDRDIDLR